jgi:pSer/pThr/pTyr-binding forkhead associated (FHA) protein
MVGTGLDCDVRVRDEYVSLYHCVVTQLDSGEFMVTDLGSMNGTWIRHSSGRQVRVRGPMKIQAGQTLVVGRSEIPWGK